MFYLQGLNTPQNRMKKMLYGMLLIDKIMFTYKI